LTVNLAEEEKCVSLIISYFNEMEEAREIREEAKFENFQAMNNRGRHQNRISTFATFPRHHNLNHHHQQNVSDLPHSNHRIWHGTRNGNCPATTKFINKKDINGESPIHIAARNENAGIVSTLLVNGADVFSV
jgi:hypothetical protein